MPDREKVIKGLNHCKSTWMCNGCPYEDDSTDDCPMYDDAIALLREQEPVEPKWFDFEDAFTEEKFKLPQCGNCESLLLSDALYCPQCGRKVKWDD